MTPEEMKHTWDGSKEWLCTANENYSSLLKEMKNDKTVRDCRGGRLPII